MSEDLPPLVKEVRVHGLNKPTGGIGQPFHNVSFFLSAQARRLPHDELWRAFEDISLAKKPKKRVRRNTGEVTLQFPVSVVAAESIRREFSQVLTVVPSARKKSLHVLDEGEKIDEGAIDRLNAQIGEARYAHQPDTTTSMIFKIATSSRRFRNRSEYRLAQKQLQQFVGEQLKNFRQASSSPGAAEDSFCGLETTIDWCQSTSINPVLQVTIKGFEDQTAAENFFEKLKASELLNSPSPHAEKTSCSDRSR